MNKTEEIGKPLVGRLAYVLATVLHVGMLLGSQGCNTTEGLGEDIENLGDNIEDEANEHK